MKQGRGMRVVDQHIAFLFDMKYYSSYQEDKCFALDENGNGTVKRVVFTHNSHPVKFALTEGNIIAKMRLFFEENDLRFPYEEITKSQYEGFGNTWVFNPLPNVPSDPDGLILTL